MLNNWEFSGCVRKAKQKKRFWNLVTSCVRTKHCFKWEISKELRHTEVKALLLLRNKNYKDNDKYIQAPKITSYEKWKTNHDFKHSIWFWLVYITTCLAAPNKIGSIHFQVGGLRRKVNCTHRYIVWVKSWPVGTPDVYTSWLPIGSGVEPWLPCSRRSPNRRIKN